MNESAEIVWLASYPKSGNTWIRFFLTALCQGHITRSSAVSEFIQEIGSAPGDGKRFHGEGLSFVTTHMKWYAGLPHWQETSHILYILRHPLDVMASNFNYHLLRLNCDLPVSLEDYRRRYCEHYLQHLDAPDWQQFPYGPWHENVYSWLSEAARLRPCLLIRYEDMLASPLDTATRIVHFLGLKKNEQAIHAAVEASSFRQMRAMEEHEIAHQIPGYFLSGRARNPQAHQYRFMNKGQSGSWKNDIPEDIQQAFLCRMKAPMKQFGYLCD